MSAEGQRPARKRRRNVWTPRGNRPVVVCPARSIQRMRVRPEWKTPPETGRLLILSPFPKSRRLATAELAARRNEFVAALAEQVFVVHAAADGKTEQLCRDLLKRSRRVWTFDRPKNEHLLSRGVTPTSVDRVVSDINCAGIS